MTPELKQKMLVTCHEKIRTKGEGVGLSFYAFFANRNDDPELLMEAATWWIHTHRLDHFEKATKILGLVEAMPVGSHVEATRDRPL
ncbi:DUF6500 family protein (plasmid) [Ralstonia sp. 25C]|uniref:DUF6500 family protein n=1 Tax=Ralstonia sp. 25C TaxID=3447363 RepID=UPI003F7524FB